MFLHVPSVFNYSRVCPVPKTKVAMKNLQFLETLIAFTLHHSGYLMLFPFDLNLPGLALENDIFHLAAFGFFLEQQLYETWTAWVRHFSMAS